MNSMTRLTEHPWKPTAISVTASALTLWLVWAGWWSPRRAYVRDLQSGLNAYLLGDMTHAQKSLQEAARRHPADPETQHLLAKVAIEDSLRQLREGKREGALARLEETLRSLPAGSSDARDLARLRQKLSGSTRSHHRDMSQKLADMVADSADAPFPATADGTRDHLRNEDLLFATMAENQRTWLLALERERALWTRFLIEGVVAVLAVGGLLLGLAALLLKRAFGRRGWMSQMIREHTQELLSAATTQHAGALPAGPGSELHKIDYIEAQLVNAEDSELAKAALRSYLEMSDPWIRARAAKAFHKLDPQAALAAIHTLIKDSSAQSQLSGVWALGELGTAESVDLLSRLAWSEDPEIQKAVMRVLVQIEHQGKLSEPAAAQVKALLNELREKTPWII